MLAGSRDAASLYRSQLHASLTWASGDDHHERHAAGKAAPGRRSLPGYPRPQARARAGARRRRGDRRLSPCCAGQLCTYRARQDEDCRGLPLIHGAARGAKLELIATDAHDSSCVVDAGDLVPEQLTTYFRSVARSASRRTAGSSSPPSRTRETIDMPPPRYARASR